MRLPSQAMLRGMQQTSTAFSRFPCEAKTTQKYRPVLEKQANENGN